MLETAMKEIHSKEAQREVGNALTAIRCMAEIIKQADAADAKAKMILRKLTERKIKLAVRKALKDQRLKLINKKKARVRIHKKFPISGHRYINYTGRGWVVTAWVNGKSTYIGSSIHMITAYRLRNAFLEKEGRYAEK